MMRKQQASEQTNAERGKEKKKNVQSSILMIAHTHSKVREIAHNRARAAHVRNFTRTIDHHHDICNLALAGNNKHTRARDVLVCFIEHFRCDHPHVHCLVGNARTRVPIYHNYRTRSSVW